MSAGNTHKQPSPRRGPITAETFAPLAAVSAAHRRAGCARSPRRDASCVSPARRRRKSFGSGGRRVTSSSSSIRSPTPSSRPLWPSSRSSGSSNARAVTLSPATDHQVADRREEQCALGRLRLARERDRRHARIESLAIGPAFEGQLSREGDEIAHGVTGQFLRLLSPPQIVAACAEKLLQQGYWLEENARRRGAASPLSARQHELLERIDHGRPRHARVSDEQLAQLARRYLDLLQQGNNRPRAQPRRTRAHLQPGP